ncbi:unnamed protein product [Brachionus calyciflorus]|uniref:Uncharacterized protein n=1 Tax=Brachionus calyciflorus TaxID=104777 RepID=A0A813MU18_9BILA|nr:unnamed protein product [Brachionus calyciflorus]
MFKVFNRGHKVNESDLGSPKNITTYRRQSSLRHSTYFGHSENYSSLGSQRPTGSKANPKIGNSKKYVSCENVRQAVEEYQDVIDEDTSEDENGFKEKLAKRYNSLTTLLMKSFRKAKIKKKKEAMMSDTTKPESNPEPNKIYEKSERPTTSNRNSLTRNNSIKPVKNENSKNTIKIKEPDTQSIQSRGTSSKPPIQKKKDSYNKNNVKSELKSEEERNDTDQSDEIVDESVPVFLGVKMISNEFVDLKPSAQKTPTISSNSKSSNLSIKSTSEKSSSTSSDRTLVEKIENTKNESKPVISSLNQTILNGINDTVFHKKDNEKKIEQPSKILYSSISKKQAPKAPVQQVTSENVENEKKNPSLKRSKTFTQQLQDILTERKRNSTPKTIHKEETNTEIFKKQKETFEPINKALGYYDSITSTKSNNYLYQDSIESTYIKQIQDFNKKSIEKESFANELFDLKEISLNNFETNDNTDDFKDLVEVLARQDNNFKKKFFNCLMTKLWDTNLPYSEYLQLNRLMSALFGENYHKLDMVYLDPKTSIHQPRISKYNTEHVVNLVKIFLDSNNNESRSVVSEDQDLEFLSVSNLINTLKRRKKHDNLALQVENFNSHFEHLVKQENKKLITTEQEIDIEKINFLNGIDTSNSKKTMFQTQLNENKEDNLSKSQLIDKTPDLYNYFNRNTYRKTIGNLESLLAQYSSGNVVRKPIQNMNDSSISFSGLKCSTLQRNEADKSQNIKSNYVKPIALKTLKSSGIIASFQPSAQFIAHDSKRITPSAQNTNTFKKEQNLNMTLTSSKVINSAKQGPPRPKILNNDQDVINLKMSKIRSVKELFKNEEIINGPESLVNKNEITLVKAENIIYSQFESKKRSISNTLPMNSKSVLSASIDSSNLIKRAMSPYSTSKNLGISGIYSTLGARKDTSDVIYFHPKQFQINKFENNIRTISANNYNSINKDPSVSLSECGRVYEKKSTKNFQLSELISDKIYKYEGREMKQAYY